MHEAEKLIQGIRAQEKLLQKLLNYLESTEQWNPHDEEYCRNTLKKAARELVHLSKGCLVTLEMSSLGIRAA